MQRFMKNTLETVRNWIYSQKAPGHFEYLVLLLLFLIPFTTMMYGDTMAFVHYGVNFWKSITQGGGLHNFYEYGNEMLAYYRANNIAGAYEVIYDFPVYIVLGIWGFPLWLVCSGFGIEETSNMWTMLYSKSVYLVALAIVAYLIYKICKNIGVDDIMGKWAAFLFLSSVLVFVEIGIAGQLDVLGMPFTLLAILCFQKKQRWRFLLFFSIAVSFKQFPLFIFLPLEMLMEKNILKIARDTVLVFAVTVLSGLPFPKGTQAMQVKDEVRGRFMDAFLGVKAPLYNSAVPVIVLLIGGICVWCYLRKLKDDNDLEQYSVFIPALSMFVLFISFDSNPYWFIHLAPFMAILIAYNSSRFSHLILFETVGMLCLIFNQFGANYWVYESYWAEGMLLDKLFGYPENLITLERFCASTNLDEFYGVFFAGFVLCIGACLAISLPGRMRKSETVLVRPYALLRLVLNAGISMIPGFLFVISHVIVL